MTELRRLYAGAVATLALAACGGSETPSGVPTGDPEEVAVANLEAAADCGEDAARRLVESTTGSTQGLTDKEAVETILEEEREQGCTPRSLGEIETIVTSQEDDVAMVETRIPEGDDAGTYIIRVVNTDDGWRVDTATEPEVVE